MIVASTGRIAPLSGHDHGSALVSRGIMAAMVEIHALGHPHDGMVLISGNDKSVPAHLLAIARCDLPALHLPGGTQLNAPALSEGWIAGAGLDDIEEEPANQRDWTPANPLFGLANAIITPHAACYSEEAIRTVRDFAASEVVRVLTGQPPLSAVNAVQVASNQVSPKS